MLESQLRADYSTPASVPQGVVDGLREQGVATIDNGATCVFVEGQPLPLMVQKSDGGYGYASTDLAALKHRLDEEKADWIIYVTGEGGRGAAGGGVESGNKVQAAVRCCRVGEDQRAARWRSSGRGGAGGAGAGERAGGLDHVGHR